MRPLVHLEPLAFLLGEWTAESMSPQGDPTQLEISYAWIHGGNFLQGTSKNQAGDTASGMTVTYLWDPVESVIRTWVLSSDGTWGRSVVEINEGVVKLLSKGITLDGQVQTLTSTLRAVSDEIRTEHWTDIRVGEKQFPDAPVIEWRKRTHTT